MRAHCQTKKTIALLSQPKTQLPFPDAVRFRKYPSGARLPSIWWPQPSSTSTQISGNAVQLENKISWIDYFESSLLRIYSPEMQSSSANGLPTCAGQVDVSPDGHRRLITMQEHDLIRSRKFRFLRMAMMTVPIFTISSDGELSIADI